LVAPASRVRSSFHRVMAAESRTIVNEALKATRWSGSPNSRKCLCTHVWGSITLRHMRHIANSNLLVTNISLDVSTKLYRNLPAQQKLEPSLCKLAPRKHDAEVGRRHRHATRCRTTNNIFVVFSLSSTYTTSAPSCLVLMTLSKVLTRWDSKCKLL
jgi:hypothetical protein